MRMNKQTEQTNFLKGYFHEQVNNKVKIIFSSLRHLAKDRDTDWDQFMSTYKIEGMNRHAWVIACWVQNFSNGNFMRIGL